MRNITGWPGVHVGSYSRQHPTVRALFRESPMADVSSFLARAGLVALALSIAGAVGPAFAASGGSSSGGSSGGSTPSCKTGYVYDSSKKTCVKATSGLFDDKQLYQQGRA